LQQESGGCRGDAEEEDIDETVVIAGVGHTVGSVVVKAAKVDVGVGAAENDEGEAAIPRFYTLLLTLCTS